MKPSETNCFVTYPVPSMYGIFTPPKTNISPKERLFQYIGNIFRGHVSFQGSTYIWWIFVGKYMVKKYHTWMLWVHAFCPLLLSRTKSPNPQSSHASTLGIGDAHGRSCAEHVRRFTPPMPPLCQETRPY